MKKGELKLFQMAALEWASTATDITKSRQIESEKFSKEIAADFKRYGDVIKAAGIKAE